MGKARAAVVVGVIGVMALAGCGVVGSSDDPTEPVVGSSDRPAGLVFVPVSGIEAPPCGPTAVEDQNNCLVLGPSRLEQSAFAYATASAGPAGGEVYPVLTDAGLEAFNEIARRCFAMTGDCATGLVAIIDGDQLVSAPKINAEQFEKDHLVISGNLSIEQAQAIADIINE